MALELRGQCLRPLLPGHEVTGMPPHLQLPLGTDTQAQVEPRKPPIDVGSCPPSPPPSSHSPLQMLMKMCLQPCFMGRDWGPLEERSLWTVTHQKFQFKWRRWVKTAKRAISVFKTFPKSGLEYPHLQNFFSRLTKDPLILPHSLSVVLVVRASSVPWAPDPGLGLLCVPLCHPHYNQLPRNVSLQLELLHGRVTS